MNLAAIDVRRILKTCKKNDRMVLQRHYLEGYKVQEIAQGPWMDRDCRPDSFATSTPSGRETLRGVSSCFEKRSLTGRGSVYGTATIRRAFSLLVRLRNLTLLSNPV